jgi:hypothetical protein
MPKVEGIQHRLAEDPAPMQVREDREAVHAAHDPSPANVKDWQAISAVRTIAG